MAKVHLGHLRSRNDPRIVSLLRYMMLQGLCRRGHFDPKELDELYRISRPTWPASLPGQPRWWYEGGDRPARPSP